MIYLKLYSLEYFILVGLSSDLSLFCIGIFCSSLFFSHIFKLVQLISLFHVCLISCSLMNEVIKVVNYDIYSGSRLFFQY